MAGPYLNSGETIILTTPKISVGSAIFDMMLTTRRIILVDNRYARFEPQMIPFSTILTVKGGKIPTGEPVISISCSDTGGPDEPTVTNLIFSQQPAELRKEERDLWVKKIIELVISARQNGANSDSMPADQDTGMRPSVRRWNAPDHLRPHSSVLKTPPEVTEVVVTHDEPDAFSSLSDTEFSSGTTILKRSELFKDWTTAGEQTIDSESTERAGAEIQKTSDSEEDSDTQEEDGSPVAAESSGLPAERPESSAEHTSAESQKEVSDLMPGTQTSSRTSFADTVLVAAKSLISDQDAKIPRDEPVVSTPAYVASPGGRNPELSEDDASIKSDGDELQPEIILSPSQKIPEFAAVPQEMVTPTRTRTRKGEDRGALIEIVGGETGVTIPGEPAEPKPAVHDGVHIPHPVKPPFKKLLGTVAVLVVIAVILIVGGAFFLSTFSSGSTSNLHTQETSPVVTVQVTPTITPLTIPPSGIWIRIVYPGTFIGTVGNPGYLYQVSGSGDKFYKTLRSDGFIQATVRKLDYSGDTLTVEVYVNGSMIAHQAVAKPMGEINLLIDAKGNLPGIPPTSIATSRTPAGSNRLVYI